MKLKYSDCCSHITGKIASFMDCLRDGRMRMDKVYLLIRLQKNVFQIYYCSIEIWRCIFKIQYIDSTTTQTKDKVKKLWMYEITSRTNYS